MAITITATRTPPDGVVGLSYAGGFLVGGSPLFVASGGVGPYTWQASGLPNGLTLQGSATAAIVQGIPAEGTDGPVSLALTVTDATSATTTQNFNFQIHGPTLTISPTLLPMGTIGHAYSVNLTVSGGVGPYGWTCLYGGQQVTCTMPSGLALVPAGATATISGMPSAAGVVNFQLLVWDNSQPLQQTGIANLSLTVVTAAPGNPITIQTATLPDAVIGASYTAQLEASGGTIPYVWSVTNGTLPAGFSLLPSGLISAGVPTQVGVFAFTVHVTDSGQGIAANRNLTLTVHAASGGPTPVITTGSLIGGIVNVPYVQVLGVTGGAPPYTWLVTYGNPPQGISLSASGVLSGIPLVVTSVYFTVQVTDGAQQLATAILQLVVNPPPTSVPVITTTSPLASAVVGDLYGAQIEATGGLHPYVWSATGVPAGLSMGPDGAMTGQPTQAGQFVITVQVVDEVGQTAARTFSLRIVGAAALGLTCPVMGGLNEGQAMAPVVVVATGGQVPYTFTATGLPDGLSLASNGVITGTPGGAGEFPYSLTVLDAALATVTVNCSATVFVPVGIGGLAVGVIESELYVGNDNLVRLMGLRDESLGKFVNTANGEMWLKDETGLPTWGPFMVVYSAGTNGEYVGTVPADTLLEANRGYRLQVVLTVEQVGGLGPIQGEWNLPVTARYREH